MPTMLSEHFSLAELIASDTALRLGIDNTPDYHALSNLHGLVDLLEWIRYVLCVPVHISSGFRCEELERVICRKDFRAWCARHGKASDEAAWGEYFGNKGHPKGFCADFTAPEFGPPLSVARALIAGDIKYHCDQLIMEGTWLHVSSDPRMRGQVMTATFTNGVANYSSGVA